jgi:hypothetical protein
MRARPPFSQRDVTRAVKAVTAAGQVVTRVEITADRIVVVTAKGGEDDQTKSRVDEWFETHARSNDGPAPE